VLRSDLYLKRKEFIVKSLELDLKLKSSPN
jgi:hypothetical protein